MTGRTLRILHLSDLHLGQDEGPDAWRVERVMGDAWTRNLREIARDGAIDLVCFTGDLAYSGKPAQYAHALRTIDAVLQSVGCPRERFFCVPGNHDVDRAIAPEAWTKLRELSGQAPQALSRWMAGGKTPFGCQPEWRDAVVSRQQAYRDFLIAADLSHLLPGVDGNPHPRLGYRRTLDLGLGEPLHILGFDSAWLAGDNHDATQLALTEDQIGRLMSGEDGKPLAGWRIGLIHHPLTDLADVRDAQRLLGEYGLGLLLHGHQHDPLIEHWADPQAGLPVLAAGCLYEHTRYPNGLLVIDVDLLPAQSPRPRQVWARRWSHRRAEWINDEELYRGTHNGRLQLTPAAPTPFTPSPGGFFGRTDELDQLCRALLPAARGADIQPTVICCAIDGMPGVGKTRLAERFITEHWLQVFPPPQDTHTGECVLRLVLSTGENQAAARSADTLLRDLADRLRLTGAPDDIRRQLPPALQQGPGGHPRLVLIENVDSHEQAEEVAALVHALPGCPVLVTARVRKFGGQDWTRVEVDPLRMEDAVDLLRNEAAAAGDDACVPDEAQARELARVLGRLPLALHIAASHLGMGRTPQEFLDELRDTGLDLAPAQQGDYGLRTDRARAILRSSFDLSWKTWCAGQGVRDGWQEALIALAHGPADSVGESLGTAIAALPSAQYGACIVAAARLSLLEWEWVGENEARERRVRLHALIAEFLRTMPQPDGAAVLARLGAWFAPRVSDQDPDTMGIARRQVQTESEGLLRWLGETRLDEAGLSIVNATHYATSNGPFGAWLARFRAALPAAGETQRGLDLMWAVTSLAAQSGDPQFALETAHAYAGQAKRLGNDVEYAVAHGKIADILQVRGELEAALRIRREEELPVYARLGDVRSHAITQGQIADILRARGELEEALRIRREEELPVYARLGDVRSRAITQGKIADILQARGELEEALRIRREEQMPVYERLGDVRSRAITQGQIADILQARGELEEALRIRREEELTVYERLGDVRSRAITQGQIADILKARGEWEEALRIRREEELPVYERLGDVRSRAIAQGKIADILQARGELEAALRIRREEELPVYERLGDVHSRAIAQGRIADILQARGVLEEALRIRREEQMPVYERLGDVRSRAITQGKIADILQARGELEMALQIRREEVLPVLERLGDMRELLVGRTNLALTLVQRGWLEDGPEIFSLLQEAFIDAERMRLPEAHAILGLITQIFGSSESFPAA